MHEFNGDLCIGGLRLKHLHGELEIDEPVGDSSEWMLSGRLTLNPSQQNLLEFGRRYRLQLDDGRGGLVVVSRIDAQRDDAMVVEFQPAASPGKPR